MLRKLKLSVALAVVQLIAAAGLQEAQAADASTGGQPLSSVCTFTADASYFANVTRPPAKLQIQWLKSTGAMLSFNWAGDPPTTWVPYVGEPGGPGPGSVKQSGTSYYYAVNIGLTCSTCIDPVSHTLARYPITGYIAPDVITGANNVTFAAIWEGTGTQWIVGQGTLTNECSLTTAQ